MAYLLLMIKVFLYYNKCQNLKYMPDDKKCMKSFNFYFYFYFFIAGIVLWQKAVQEKEKVAGLLYSTHPM